MASRLLDQIDGPSDLKTLTHEELTQVAQEVRDTIISVITERGGHLASNLGVVELTLALHCVFDSPIDRIVWDTTNQCYAHKLVTGRRDAFKDIRLEGGLSGFGEPSESPHDTLAAGHAGTGLSIALGVAQGAATRGVDSWTIAVVGDGAMTSGSSFEALNNIVHLDPNKFIVVLNDNGMSISENIGFLTNWRKRVITHPEYQAMIGRMRALSKRVPTGDMVYRLVKRFGSGLDSIIVPTTFWTEIGFQYLGPVDGHDFKQLEQTLRQAKASTGLVPLVHVVTHKGTATSPPRTTPSSSTSQAHPSGTSSGAPTYSKVVQRRDAPTYSKVFAQTIHGRGHGLRRPHSASRAFDQVILDVPAGPARRRPRGHPARTASRITARSTSPTCGAPQRRRRRPDGHLQHLVYTAYRHPGPFVIRIPRGPATGAPLDKELRQLPLGRGTLVREGRDVVIFALGKPGSAAVEAADQLADLRHRLRRRQPVASSSPSTSTCCWTPPAARPHRHRGGERARRWVRLRRARGARRRRHGGRVRPPHRPPRLVHRAQHRGRPAAAAGTGRRRHRPAGPARASSRGASPQGNRSPG